MEEVKNVYENDLKMFYLFKQTQESNDQFEIPELFINKYKIMHQLDTDNKLTLENFINKSKDNDIKIKRKKVDDITTFDKKMNIDRKIKCFEKYIEAFLQLYKDLSPLIAKKEKHMNKIALSINDVASELQGVIDSL